MKRNLCVPCAAELTAKRDVQLIGHTRDNKITCEKCGRRRYGNVYEVRWKTNKSKSERKAKT